MYDNHLSRLRLMIKPVAVERMCLSYVYKYI